MNRAVIIVAYEDQYEGLHGINDVRVEEADENELPEIQEIAQEMCNEVIDSYSCCEGGEGEYMIYRQKDESTLTTKEVEEIVNDYGIDVDKYEDFDDHFKTWD